MMKLGNKRLFVRNSQKVFFVRSSSADILFRKECTKMEICHTRICRTDHQKKNTIPIYPHDNFPVTDKLIPVLFQAICCPPVQFRWQSERLVLLFVSGTSTHFSSNGTFCASNLCGLDTLRIIILYELMYYLLSIVFKLSLRFPRFSVVGLPCRRVAAERREEIDHTWKPN